MRNKLFFVVCLLGLLSLIACKNEVKVKILKDIEYSSYPFKKDKKKLLLDLYLPDIKSSHSLPVLIYIPGGGWLKGDKKSCPGTVVAKQGYILACVNYRHSTEAIFPAQIYDVKNAVRWLRSKAEKYNLDPHKIGVWGESAGGHLSALLGTSAGVKALEGDSSSPSISSQVQAVCDWYGPTDFTQVPPAFEEPITPAVLEKYKNAPWVIYTEATYRLVGGPVSRNIKLAHLANPINYIDVNDPPFLIVHGELDNIVPLSQSELLAKALQQKGVEVTFVREPNLKHSYAGKQGEHYDPKLVNMAIDFFDTHLRKDGGRRAEGGGKGDKGEKPITNNQ